MDNNKKLEHLKAGYHRFRSKYFTTSDNKTFENLRTGQSPNTLVIACSDSRVDPAIIMDCVPGDLFVVRNVANLVPPCESSSIGYHGTSAALEFGVTGLKVKNILVLGHSMCGGISSLFNKNNKEQNKSFVDKWMEIASGTCNDQSIHQIEDLSQKIDHCSKLAIIKSLKNLMSFPWIKEGVEKKELIIHGWYFDIKTGQIHCFDEKLNQFIELI